MHKHWMALGALALAIGGCNGKDKDSDSSGPPNTDTTGTSTGATTGATTGAATGAGTGTGTGSTTTTFEWPATPQDYVFGDGSYMYEFQIPDMQDPVDECCRDWGAISRDNIENGTNELDNALANLGAAAVALGLDLQATIDATIQDGSFVALLDFYDLPVGGGDFHLVFFPGEFEGATTYVEASAGTGTFQVDELNFVSPTGTPRARFAAANLTGSALTASGGTFEIAMPLTDNSVLVLPLKDVTLDGTATVGANGVSITDGVLSGYVEASDFYGSYNTVVNTLCGCLGLAGDLYTQDGAGNWTGDCQGDSENLCPGTDQEVCSTLAGTNLFNGEVCLAIPGLITNASDLDLDGNTADFEALSAGLRFSTTDADIVGLVPPTTTP